jgi:hypothetical protein
VLLWVRVEQLQRHSHSHQTTETIQYLEVLQQLQAVVADLGMAMRVVRVDQAVVDALDQTELDQIITPVLMIVVIKTWAVEELKDKVFLEVLALDLIVKVKTVTDPVVVAVLVVLDLAARTIAVWVRLAMAVRAQPVMF